jgi:prevent-host-death family protein
MKELSRNAKGALAEAEAEAAGRKAGFGVYRPTSGHSRADMIFEDDENILRIQVKWAQLDSTGDFIRIRTSGSRCTPHGYVVSRYDESEVDYLVAYCGELDRCFMLPVAMFREHYTLQLRLTPPNNNQRACINLAERFAFPGPVVQLGEHPAGSRKVRGSSPLRSIDRLPASEPAIVVKANPFRDHLGYWMDTVAEGQEVVVTRHGKPRFKLVPIDPEGEDAGNYEAMTAKASVVAAVRYADLFPTEPVTATPGLRSSDSRSEQPPRRPADPIRRD